MSVTKNPPEMIPGFSGPAGAAVAGKETFVGSAQRVLRENIR